MAMIKLVASPWRRNGEETGEETRPLKIIKLQTHIYILCSYGDIYTRNFDFPISGHKWRERKRVAVFIRNRGEWRRNPHQASWNGRIAKGSSMARASRKARLPTSGAIAGKVRWSPGTDTWLALEAAYGVALSEEVCAKIAEIVNRYFESEAFARDAPFVKDSLAWLSGLQTTVAAAVAAYNSPRGPQPKKQKNPAKKKSAEAIAIEDARAAEEDARARKARSYLEAEIDDYLQDIGGGVNFRARDLVDIMTKASTAAGKLSDDISAKDSPRFHEKNAWRAMIRRLWKLARKNELPSAIDKNNHPKVSPFVAFVKELQLTFGEAAKAWHMQSDLSLAENMLKAISDVRES